MKTLSLLLDEYNADLQAARIAGHKRGFERALEILKAVHRKDFREASCILYEELADEKNLSVKMAAKFFRIPAEEFPE